MRHAALAAALVAVVLMGTGCALHEPQARPLVVRLADIQSHTVPLRLHPVLRIDLGSSRERYAPEVADPAIVTVVQRRAEAQGRVEPELVPRRVGSTQVALIAALPSDTVGFRVTVTP